MQINTTSPHKPQDSNAWMNKNFKKWMKVCLCVKITKPNLTMKKNKNINHKFPTLQNLQQNG